MDMVTHNEKDTFLAADELTLQDLMEKNNEWSREDKEYVTMKIVSLFAWSLIVIDGTKVFCRILWMMHMTRKIASEEQDESMADIEPPPLKTKTFQEAIQSLENVQQFLESQGLLQQAMSIGDAVDDLLV